MTIFRDILTRQVEKNLAQKEMNLDGGIKLAEAKPENFKDLGTPKTQKKREIIPRVKLSELESIYMKDGIIFNGINKITQTIMAAGYTIDCSNQRIKKYYENFLDGIGNSGGELTWDELLQLSLKYQCIYGHGWVENIMNKQSTRIVDLDIIDPKKMDYALNSSKDIVLDKFGRIVGYTQEIERAFGGKAQIEGDPWPTEYNFDKSGKIFLKPERIAHFKLFTVGDGFYPTGLIEPCYNQAIWKMNIEKGLANFIYTSGFPTRVGKVGDLNHEPTPQQVENMLEKLKQISYKQNIATPYYDEIKLLESKAPEKMQENLNYFTEQQIAGLGIPKPFITGGGEETNRATLGNQDRIFRLTLKDITNRTCSVINKQIFARIAQLEGFNVVPKIVWNEIEETAEIERINVILEAAKSGVIKPDEAKEEIMRLIKYK